MIHKQVLEFADSQYVNMPGDARLLHVGEQRGRLTLWYLFDAHLNMAEKSYQILIAGTGNSYPLIRASDVHIGTVLTEMGLVWHVFWREHLMNLLHR